MTTIKKSVSLNPGESKAVSFSFTPTVAKAYNVMVDGLTGSFNAVQPPSTEFNYTSNLIVNVIDYPTPHDIEWTVSVQNVGEGAGVLHLDLYLRMEEPGVPGSWAQWRHIDAVSETIAASESKTITGRAGCSPYFYELKVESEAGTLVKYFHA